MRFAALLFAVSPSLVFADTIVTRTTPTDVTVFTQGAEVTRKGQIDLPAGIHDIVIPDLRPNDGGTQTPAITLSGATLISEKWQNTNPIPMGEPTSTAYTLAKADLDNARTALATHKDEIQLKLLAKTAAQAQIAFLKSLASSNTLPNGIDTLRDLSRMISQETLNAHQAIQQADIMARQLNKDLPDLQEAVANAKRAVDAILPPSDQFAQLILTVSVPEPTTSDIGLKYLVRNAGWRPVYDMWLTTGDDPKLVMERGALLAQNSGERWEDVNLTLSTIAPQERPEPNIVQAKRLRISDPAKNKSLTALSRQQADTSGVSALRMSDPIIIEAAASANADMSGITAQYNFDYTLSVDSSDEFSRVALGTLDFDAAIEARAIPLNNETAFRMVTFTNSSGERLLPAQASLYVDDRLIADTFIDQIVPGAETEIGFGPIHGLRLTRTILNRNEGDRGIISRSNENTESVRIDLENLTNTAWNVTVLDRVPYTEQEDLSIDWSAAPRPTTTDFEDQRGILHWDLEVNSGQTQSITLDTKIIWPEGMILR